MRRLSTAVPPPHDRHGRPRLATLVTTLGLLAAPLGGSMSAQDAAEAPASTPSASAGAVAAQTPTPDEAASDALLAAVAKAAAATTTVIGSCEWRTTAPGQDQPGVLGCRFALAAPDRYNIVESDATKSEWKKRLCSDGETQWEIEATFAGVKPDVTTARASPDSDLNRLFACLRGDTTRLRERYRLTAAAGAQGGATIALTPKPGLRTDLVRGEITLDAQDHVQALALTLDGGQRIEVRITAATYGGEVPAGEFQGPPADR